MFASLTLPGVQAVDSAEPCDLSSSKPAILCCTVNSDTVVHYVIVNCHWRADRIYLRYDAYKVLCFVYGTCDLQYDDLEMNMQFANATDAHCGLAAGGWNVCVISTSGSQILCVRHLFLAA